MLGFWWIVLIVAAIAAALFLVAWRPYQIVVRETRFAATMKSFRLHRERLEAKFIQLASANAQPNSPHWEDCFFDDDVAYVRSRRTGELSAFVALTVATDIPEVKSLDIGRFGGGPIEMIRTGTAIFHFAHNHWETDGRAILDLNPTEAIQFYHNDLRIIGERVVSRS